MLEGDPRIGFETIGQRAVDAIVLDLAAVADPVTMARAMAERRPGNFAGK